MREAANTLEYVSHVYDYMKPECAQWSAASLRNEAFFVEEEAMQ